MTSPWIALLVLVAQAAPLPSPDARAKAQVLLTEGARAYEHGDPASALEKFEAAYAEFASPKLLYNIGQASRDVGRLAEAMVAFERFLAEAPDASADMTAEARRSLAELEGRLGRIRVECDVADAEIGLDGKPVGLSPLGALLWASPGRHQVTARHPEVPPAIEDVDVKIGAVANVTLRLRSRPKPDWAAHAMPSADPATPAPGGFWLGRKWTWVAAGSAVLFGGAGVGVGLAMRSKYDSLNRTCGSASANYQGCNESQISQVSSRKTAANVLFGLSATAAVTAAVLFYIEGRRVVVAPMVGASTGLSAGITY